HWQMLREHLLWFGQRLTIPIDVVVTLPTKPGTPTDAGTCTNETLVNFSWTESTDSVSGIAGYNCRIGTTPGGNQAYDGFVGNVLAKSVNGSIGTTYYCHVQGKDNVGNVGPWSDSSDGIMVVENAGVSVAAAKFLPDGSTLGMSSEVVTAVFGDCFYVQESGGIPGIRVDPPAMPAGLAIGKTVDVWGTMKTTSSGERYIQGDASVLD
ncbi:unnamed protein product, partial [marine sediment metagenome]